MTVVRSTMSPAARSLRGAWMWLYLLTASLLLPWQAYGQAPLNGPPSGFPPDRLFPSGPLSSGPSPSQPTESVSQAAGKTVVDVRIVGNETVNRDQIVAALRTRRGRIFNPEWVQPMISMDAVNQKIAELEAAAPLDVPPITPPEGEGTPETVNQQQLLLIDVKESWLVPPEVSDVVPSKVTVDVPDVNVPPLPLSQLPAVEISSELPFRLPELPIVRFPSTSSASVAIVTAPDTVTW